MGNLETDAAAGPSGGFAWHVPERYNFTRDVIGRWAEDPDQLAMLWVGDAGEERRLTFRDFYQRARRFARLLQDHGIAPGDRVMLQLPRVPAWWEVMLGCTLAGAVPVPSTILLTPKDIRFRTTLAEGTAYVADPENAAKVDQVRADGPPLRLLVCVGEPPSDGWLEYEPAMARTEEAPRPVDTLSTDPALVYFTSGTVGNPKMVLHTHSYPIGHQVTGRYWLDLGPRDLHLNLAETGWAKAAWSSLYGPWNQGAALFQQDQRGRFSASDTLDLLERYPITTFCAPPTAYRMLVLEDLERRRPSALRWCVGAGEPLNPEVIAAWERGTGLTIRDGYGQTETVLLCGNPPGLEVRPGSMGRPMPGFRVAVIDDGGEEVPVGEEGDIAVEVEPVRPPGIFREYWHNEAATRAARRGGWYVTGDRAVRDDDGYLWFVGRSDDVIISAGYRIGPFEVESALLGHAAVAESAVVAKADPLRGTIVKAFCVLAPGFEGSPVLVEELQAFVRGQTAPYKYPREIEFVSDLPKTISGKIRRVELRTHTG
ncbi:MAG: AMP-binding protein [Candidatus Dormiibacterota bacterium]